MRPAEDVTVVDCSGVGPGGITRVLTEVVRHWPAGHRLRLVAVPPAWSPPADVAILSRQAGGRSRTIASATATLRRESAGAARVLSLSPSLAIAASRRPVVTVVHDLAFRLWPAGLPAAVRGYRRLSYATAVRRSARLLCVSARTRHDLAGLYGVDADVWYPGSDVTGPGRAPAAVEALDSYLVVPGHAPHKGVELAIEALPLLPAQHLVILAGGRDVPRSDRVIVLDHLGDAEYAATIAGAAAVVMPSHFEGYGLPAVEALRLGTPVVVSPDPALLEATGGQAVRMTSWTAPALAEAVAVALAGPRPPAGHSGRTWAEATRDLVSLLCA